MDDIISIDAAASTVLSVPDSSEKLQTKTNEGYLSQMRDMSVIVACLLVILTMCLQLIERFNKDRYQWSKISQHQESKCSNTDSSTNDKSETTQLEVESQLVVKEESESRSSSSKTQKRQHRDAQQQIEPQQECSNKNDDCQGEVLQQTERKQKRGWTNTKAYIDCNPQCFEPGLILTNSSPQQMQMYHQPFDPMRNCLEKIQYIRSCGFPSFFLENWLEGPDRSVFKQVDSIAASVGKIEPSEVDEFPSMWMLREHAAMPQWFWDLSLGSLQSPEYYFEACCKINGLPWYTTPQIHESWNPSNRGCMKFQPLLYAPRFGPKIGATWYLSKWYEHPYDNHSAFQIDCPSSSMLANGTGSTTNTKLTKSGMTATYSQPWKYHNGNRELSWFMPGQEQETKMQFVPVNQVEIVRKGLMGANGLDGSIINIIASFLDYSTYLQRELERFDEYQQEAIRNNRLQANWNQVNNNAQPINQQQQPIMINNQQPVAGLFVNQDQVNNNRQPINQQQQPIMINNQQPINGLFVNQDQVNNNAQPINQQQQPIMINNQQPVNGLFANQNQVDNNVHAVNRQMIGFDDERLFGNQPPGNNNGQQALGGQGLLGNNGGLFGNWNPNNENDNAQQLNGNGQLFDQVQQQAQEQGNGNNDGAMQPVNGGLIGNQQLQNGGLMGNGFMQGNDGLLGNQRPIQIHGGQLQFGNQQQQVNFNINPPPGFGYGGIGNGGPFGQ